MELKVDRINKSFGEKHVLKDVSFLAKSGKALGLLGRNGSGKTTTIRIIMDIFPSDSGSVMIDNTSNKKSKIKIGYLPEERGLYPKKTVSEQMIYFGELRGLTRAEAKENSLKMLRKLEADEYLDKKLETLSKGNQQKIQLALAIINDPDIVILDEPFSGLDPVNSLLLRDMVKDIAERGKIVLFSSHQMNYVEEFCDDICMIDDGKIVLSGSLRQIKKSYPRNMLLISVDEDKLGAISEAVKGSQSLSSKISDISTGKAGITLTLKRPEDKQSVFSSDVFARFDIDGIHVVEPTLEQIFIEKAGETVEAVR